MTIGPRSWATLLFLWLSLAAVLAPALDPTGSPVLASRGSAFDPFTDDVSLGPTSAPAAEADREFQNAKSDQSRDLLARVSFWLIAFPCLAWLSETALVTFRRVLPASGIRRLLRHSVQARAPPYLPSS